MYLAGDEYVCTCIYSSGQWRSRSEILDSLSYRGAFRRDEMNLFEAGDPLAIGKGGELRLVGDSSATRSC